MKWRMVLALGLVLHFAGVLQAQQTIDKAMSTFTVADGLEWKAWATEPLCVNPTCMDVDHKGRVWMVESINYRTKLRNQPPRRPEGDRIMVLEDKKRTGQADSATVFYQAPEILSPLGIAVYPYTDGVGSKVYVCQSPDIWVFEDKNGDLKADGPPKKLLTGFKGVDHDHGVHGILIGPDNRLYFTVGDAGVQNLQASDGKGPKFTSNGVDIRAATVWRCDLDGKNLELIAHNFRNNYEPAVDSFGTVFLSDNDDDGNQQTRICYVMPGGNYGYHHTPKVSHWNEEMPGIVPKILRTYFGSPTGICVYEGSLLPKSYRGQLLHTDAGPRHVRCYHLEPQGAAYRATQENMVESKDTWFRPSDVCVAPDGAVFVADWYDPGVGGHGVGDFTRGRIFRIAPKGSQPSVPALDLTTGKGVLAALGSPNLATRAAAMARIQEMKSADASKTLQTALESDVPWVRARALWQIALTQKDAKQVGGRAYFEKLASQKGPDEYRILAMRVLKDVHGLAPLADYPLPDRSAAVSREALVLLRDVSPEKSKNHILALAKEYDGKDRFFLAAVGIAVGHHDQGRREAILADFDKAFPEWNDKVAGLLWELRPPRMAALLERKLGDPKIAPAQRLLIVDILGQSNDPQSGMVLLQALPAEKSADVRDGALLTLTKNLPGKWNKLSQSAELGKAIESLLKQPATTSAAYSLIAAAQRKDSLPTLLKAAQDWDDLTESRRSAIRALGAFSDPTVTSMLGLLFQQQKRPLPDSWKADVIAALGKQGTLPAQQVLEGLTTQPKEVALPLRQAAVAALAASKSGAIWLLEAYSSKQLSEDLTSDLSRLLRNSTFADLKKKANATLPAPPKLDPKKLPSIPALLARKGNAERGKSLMELTAKNDAACLKCHVINKVGGNVGPELSVIGSKASKENLLESILYPHRAIADQYIQWVVETNGGQVINGLLVEETPDHLVLRDVNAKDHKVAKGNIASKNKSPNSIMPDNLLVFMSEDDLLDLVEYLFTLKSPAIAPISLHRTKESGEHFLALLVPRLRVGLTFARRASERG